LFAKYYQNILSIELNERELFASNFMFLTVYNIFNDLFCFFIQSYSEKNSKSLKLKLLLLNEFINHKHILNKNYCKYLIIIILSRKKNI